MPSSTKKSKGNSTTRENADPLQMESLSSSEEDQQDDEMHSDGNNNDKKPSSKKSKKKSKSVTMDEPNSDTPKLGDVEVGTSDSNSNNHSEGETRELVVEHNGHGDTVQPRWRTKKTLLSAALTVIVIVVIVVVVAVVTGNNASSSSSSATSGATESEPYVWTPGTFGPEYYEVVDKLSPLFPLNQKNIPTSKLQEDALLWLTYEDPSPDTPSLSPQLLLERFVMAVLYNATDGSAWLDKDMWLTETSICEWGTSPSEATAEYHVKMMCDNTTGFLEELVVSTKASSTMHGVLPTELGLMTNLKTLSISNSPELTGTIPTQLGNLKQLNQLVLQANGLSGSIPRHITSYNRLTLFNVAMNQKLSGTIPSRLENLLNLEVLWLNDNAFEGTIPSELSTLIGLYELWLHNNDLVGTLPESIYQDLTMAYSIRVDGNSIEDCPTDIPAVIC
mmetsp:Transcript_30035/g.49860  ORF Transcript_30035/g.49860 Transcript_30035/m.49860 type:complete len:448 (+) Transcript_30035:146-1489(+)